MFPRLKEGELGSRPTWEEFFMSLAIVYSSRSSCRKVRAGSVLVEGKHVVGLGYNGAPKQIPSCYSIGCEETKKGLNYEESLNSGTCIGIHAEKNAMGNLIKTRTSNLELFTTVFPCHDCAKDLLPYDLKKVTFKRVYSSKEFDSTVELLERAEVEVVHLDLSPERFLDILFTPKLSFERKFDVWDSDESEIIKNLVSEPKKKNNVFRLASSS